MGDRIEVECMRGVQQVAATTINQQFNILNNRKILSPRFKNVSRHTDSQQPDEWMDGWLNVRK